MGAIVAKPNEYLAVTGAGIDGIKIVKTYWWQAFQEVRVLDVTPVNYTFELNAMSSEKMEFVLPVCFTIGVRLCGKLEDDLLELKKYALFLSGSADVHKLIEGIIEGETRVLAANMTIEDMFKNRSQFKIEIIAKVQTELDQFGLQIFNANVKELKDAPGSEYFHFLRQKTCSAAENQAKVEVAQATLQGVTGEKERQGLQRRKVAEVETSTSVFENEQAIKLQESRTQLEQRQFEMQQAIGIAKAIQAREVERKDLELRRQVEITRAETELEAQRATTVAKAKANYEKVEKDAEADAIRKIKDAEAELLVARKKAEGVEALYKAEAAGLQSIIGAFHGDNASALSYIMITKGVYESLATKSADAIRGLQPNISVWNTGAAAGGEGSSTGAADPLSVVRNLAQSIIPMVSTVQQQTGITPPAWMMNMPTKQGSKAAGAIEHQ